MLSPPRDTGEAAVLSFRLRVRFRVPPVHCWPGVASPAWGTCATSCPSRLAGLPRGLWCTSKLTDPRRKRDTSDPVCAPGSVSDFISSDQFEGFMRNQRIVVLFFFF